MPESATCINRDSCLPFLSRGMCGRCYYYEKVYTQPEVDFNPDLLKNQIDRLKKEMSLLENKLNVLLVKKARETGVQLRKPKPKKIGVNVG